MGDYFVAHAIGFIGSALCIACFQCKKEHSLILVQTAGNVAFIIHYILLGAYSGCAGIVLSAVSNMILLLKMHHNRWAAWKGWKWVLSIMAIAIGIATWRTVFSIFPAIASIAFILTNWSGSAKVIRVGKLACVGPCWLIYNLSVRSYSGILTESIGICSALIALIRYRENRQRKS